MVSAIVGAHLLQAVLMCDFQNDAGTIFPNIEAKTLSWIYPKSIDGEQQFEQP